MIPYITAKMQYTLIIVFVILATKCTTSDKILHTSNYIAPISLQTPMPSSHDSEESNDELVYRDEPTSSRSQPELVYDHLYRNEARNYPPLIPTLEPQLSQTTMATTFESLFEIASSPTTPATTTTTIKTTTTTTSTTTTTTPPPRIRVSPKRRQGAKRFPSSTTTTTTTTTTTQKPSADYADGEVSTDYYEYEDQMTTTTTTTTARPKGRKPKRGRMTTSTTPKPTTTLSPGYQPRPDGRIIDYMADPNFPRELKGADLTNYPFYISVPEKIDFECKNRHDGYYSNIDLHCQIYHHCAVGNRYDFLCPNYTLFDQTTFTCRFINMVDCQGSAKHFDRNNALYVEKDEQSSGSSTTSTSTTTTTTTKAPRLDIQLSPRSSKLLQVPLSADSSQLSVSRVEDNGNSMAFIKYGYRF